MNLSLIKNPSKINLKGFNNFNRIDIKDSPK